MCVGVWAAPSLNVDVNRISELERQLQFDRAEAEEVKIKLDQQRKVGAA